jgi:hypothetical protein
MARAILVYLAGKISKNGWRKAIVPNLRSVVNGADEIMTVDPVPTIIERLYTVGPFFIGCDHGCYHGENSHGVSANKEELCNGISISSKIVPALCADQILKSDFLFAFINELSCYGTLCEIGYAVGRGIPVAVLFANKSIRSKMWFIGEMADIDMCAAGDKLLIQKVNVKDPDVAMMAKRVAYNLVERCVI